MNGVTGTTGVDGVNGVNGTTDVDVNGTNATNDNSVASATYTTSTGTLHPRQYTKRNIFGMELKELEEEMARMGLPKWRAETIFNWVYRKGVRDFDSIVGFTKDTRIQLSRRFTIGYPGTGDHQKSSDGTQKWLAALKPGQSVETVYIPAEYEGENELSRDRGAICVSSQVGCTLSCAFCHTGTMDKSKLRNLSTEEIIGQVMMAKSGLNDWMGNIHPGNGKSLKITNVVMMGMGEPLYNYRNVLRALKLMNDPLGLAISKRKLTLSTSGVVPNIYKLAQDLPVSLAISLHAVTNELRDRIVPVNKQWPLEELLAACRAYPGVKPNRKMTFEYVMLKGVNDSDADARQLVRLLKDIPALVNLIPFNPWKGAPFESSSNNTIHRFASIVEAAGMDLGLHVASTPRSEVTHSPTNELRSRRLFVPNLQAPTDLAAAPASAAIDGIGASDGLAADDLSSASSRSVFLKCTIRWPRGRDIMAACGQLAVKQAMQTPPTGTPAAPTAAAAVSPVPLVPAGLGLTAAQSSS